MRKRDLIIIIATLLLLLIGSQIFHFIRYNSLQNRINSEFSELAYDFCSAVDDLTQNNQTDSAPMEILSIAHTLGEFINYIDDNTSLSTAETSEIRMFIWSLYPYLSSALTSETIDQKQLATISAIFHAYYDDPEKKDIMAALYRQMHSTDINTAAVNTVLHFS